MKFNTLTEETSPFSPSLVVTNSPTFGSFEFKYSYQNLMINLLPGERVDDLERNGYKIIQNKEKFCFGMDAVLLSGFGLWNIRIF